MKRKYKIIMIIVAAIIFLSIVAFSILYFNGYSGLHNHTPAKEGQIKVACVGDSITYGHGIAWWDKNNYPAQLQELLGDDYHVANFGHSGRTVSNNGDQPYTQSEQYKLSLEYNADIIVFMLGTNDTKPQNWTDTETFIKEYDELLESYKKNNPNVKIIICTPAKAFFEGDKTDGTTNFDIQPNIVKAIKTRILSYALLKGYDVVNVYDITEFHDEWFSDNVHPSKDGARAIAEAIASKISK